MKNIVGNDKLLHIKMNLFDNIEVFIRGNDELTGFSTVRVKVVAENGEVTYTTFGSVADAYIPFDPQPKERVQNERYYVKTGDNAYDLFVDDLFDENEGAMYAVKAGNSSGSLAYVVEKV